MFKITKESFIDKPKSQVPKPSPASNKKKSKPRVLDFGLLTKISWDLRGWTIPSCNRPFYLLSLS